MQNIKQDIKIGFIGQGYVGKNMANAIEKNGFEIIRYSLEPEYLKNKDLIKCCDIVFIAVPTPTNADGQDGSIVAQALSYVGAGKIAVIKSTILPGTTSKLQKKYPSLFILHCPEFLTEAKAEYESSHPLRNILGLPVDNAEFRKKAALVLSVLPKASYELICKSAESEVIKYGGNNFLYAKVVFMNVLFDYCKEIGADWQVVKNGMIHDIRIGESHMQPERDGGRGAGGHCFPKDFEAFLQDYMSKNAADSKGLAFLEAMRDKNVELLKSSGKNPELLKAVYG